MRHHDHLMKSAIADHRGFVFKTVGDGFHADFDTPVDALQAALTAQRALAVTEWTTFGLAEPVRVRIAINAGDVEDRCGDFEGPTLNRLSRLLAAGHGGQILIAGSAADRLAAELPEDVTLRDLGERRLRDVPGSERIFQVDASDLPWSFPPLRTLDPTPHNLPVSPTLCIGRETERRSLLASLPRSENRLTTLLGPGGIGKTRLALQVAEDLLDAFPDGVWFVDLTTVRDPAFIVSSTVQALGLREDPGSDPTTTLVNWLTSRELLLLFDNCEQIVDDMAAFVAGLLRSTATLRVLATSRSPLRIRGERIFQVEPLHLPAPTDPPDEVLRSSAVRLFASRVSERVDSFVVDGTNRDQVAAICRHLDGIPLALELAASHPRADSPLVLLDLLNQRLDSLADGPRDLPTRQQTLRNALAWSYDLLDLSAQSVFAQCGVFVGGWTPAAAAAVTLSPAVAGSLDTIASSSLTRRELSAHAEDRFTMLETIREFALEQLANRDLVAITAERHATWFLELAEQYGPQMEIGGDQREWMSLLDRELGNLRAAITYFQEQGRFESLLRMATALQYYWSSRGLVSEGSAVFDQALPHIDTIDPELAMHSWKRRGNLAIDLGELEHAQRAFSKSLEVARLLNHPDGIARGLSSLGFVANLQGRHDDEALYHAEGRALFESLGDRHGVAVILLNQAHWARDTGQLDLACAFMEESIARRAELDDRLAIIYSKAYLGRFERERGRLEIARTLFEEAIAEMHEFGDTNGLPIALNGLGATYLDLGELDLAETTLRESLERTRAEGDRPNSAEALEWLADLSLQRNNPESAAAALEEATNLRIQARWPVPTGDKQRVARLHTLVTETIQSPTRLP